MTKQSFAWVSRITKAMVEIAIVLDMNCSAFPLTWEFSIVSAEGEELQDICPISVSPRGKQGHTCDTLVWQVHLSITCRIMCENRRVWNGLWRCQFRKKTVFFFFLREWKYISAEPSACWIFYFIPFTFEKPFPSYFPMHPSARYPQPMHLSVAGTLFYSDAQWHQNCSIWSFMAFSDLVGF